MVPSPTPHRFRSFLGELQRRHVFRMAAVYAAVALGVIYAADAILPRLLLPEWTVTLVIVLVILGFPIALAVSWAVDVSESDGKKSDPTDETGSSAGPASAPPRPAPRSVAVLPFANMSADPENEYFSDGITEEIINALTKVPGLQVAARTSCFVFKEKAVDIRTIGERLNVGAVVEGSVRRMGSTVRITAQLIDVSNGYHLWSDRYDREMEDIFEIQDEISLAISQTLTEKLGASETSSRARQSTSDVTAYELYLKGRYHWNRRTNPAMRKAVEYFELALERDPAYAPAYAGIADCYTLLGWVAFGGMPPHEAFPKAEAAALRALELDPTLAEAYNSLGWTRLVYSWTWEDAEEAFQRALELDPRYAMGRAWYAMHLAWTGRMDEAISEAAHAQRLDPLSLIIHTLAGWVYYFAGRYHESIEHYRKTLELDPDYVRTYLGLGWAYEALGDVDRAIDQFRTGVELSKESPRYVAALGHAYAQAGREEEARDALRRLRSRSEGEYVSPFYFASVYAGLGDHDRVFEWLERAYEERSGALVFLPVDPQMESLRDDARFADLTARVGVPTTVKLGEERLT